MTTIEILQGIKDWTNGKIVYDISVAHPDGQGNPTPYADLTTALGTGGANIPEGLRKGGMSVKFIQGTVQGSDNKYVQYRYMGTEVTGNPNPFLVEGNWEETGDSVKVAASSAESDLDISDEQGNVLVRFANGHIQVKNFSSAKNNANIGIDSVEAFNEGNDYNIDDIVKYDGLLYKFIVAHTAGEWNTEEVEPTNILSLRNSSTEHPIAVGYDAKADLDISDEQGNVLMRLVNGGIKTKTFDSEKGFISKSLGYNLMNSVDMVLPQLYPLNYINFIKRGNERYDFGNVRVVANFVVPDVGNTVNIQISSNPTYRTNIPFFSVGTTICIGNKDIYDEYSITAINGTTISCKMMVCNTNCIGETMLAEYPHTNENPDKGHQVCYDITKVYRKDDLLGYHSDVIPVTATRDGTHPSSAQYNTIGVVIGECLLRYFNAVNRVICFGDSLTEGSNGWDGMRSVLPNVTIINQGVASDRIEHIIDRFITYLNTYTAQENDVFIFVMGTNNLSQAVKNGLSPYIPDVDFSDPQMKFWNKSYLNTFKEACNIIASNLPKGNYLISNSHLNSTTFK